jgi:protein-L-isoaspartate O-methyltransferase
MNDFEATYSPDDNKLRFTAVSRLDPELYKRVHDAGFRWAPVQKVFVAGMWTPEREDLLIELAGEIGDHDNSLMDRAEERSDRFEVYRENRTRDASQAQDAVHAITDGIPLGQPILVGHHSERHARKDQERIENGMRKALKMWKTAEYWKRRAAGAIAHAKYKELPDVRARRIKTIEADRRKRERSKKEAAEIVRRFALVDNPDVWKPRPDGSVLTREERAYYMAGKLSGGPYMATVHTDGPNATTLRYSAYDVLAPDDQRYSKCPRMSVDEVAAKLAAWCDRVAVYADRWIEHYDNRLAYEKAMLADQGASELIAPTPRRKGKTVYPICNYRAPEGITVQNAYGGGDITYPQIEMTSAEYAKIPDDYKGTHVVEYSHRVRISFRAMKSAAVFLTDSKVHPKPAAGQAPQRAPRRVYTPPAPREKTHAEIAIEQLQQGITAGVQVVSAPQLFPTPAEVAEYVVDCAEIEPGMCTLEPNAGTGALVRAIRAKVDTEVRAYEINQALCSKLRQSFESFELVVECADFLQVTEYQGRYPRIVMNPPFSNGDDIKHIEHARTFLAPGGILVAICAAGPRQQEKYGAYIVRELPAGTFEGTNVRSLIIRIEA